MVSAIRNLKMTSLTSPQPPQYTIRQCTTHGEFTACLALQKGVWGFADLVVTPLRSFVIAMHSGGFTLGAFDRENTMIGFVHALAAFDKERRPYYYSQML